MAGARRIVVEFIGDGSSLTSELGSLQTKTGKFGTFMGKVGKAAFLGIAGGAVLGGAALVKFGQKASDLNETISKTNQIFGSKAGKQLQIWAEDTDRQLGMSKQTTLDAAATFGVFGKAAGKSGQDLRAFAQQNTMLAADLASFNNTTPEEAIVALGAAFRGESEPLRAYGVLLDDASLRQEALAQGLVKTTKEALTPQQKVLASQALILKQTGDAQGDFAKTSDGLANRQRILKAEFENMQTSIGQKVLPVMLTLAEFTNDKVLPALSKLGGWLEQRVVPVLQDLGHWIGDTVVPAVRKFAEEMQSGEGSGGKFADALDKVQGALEKAWGILKPVIDFMANNKTVVATFAGVILTVAAAAKVWAIAQAVLNAVLLANPLGLIVVAIAALAAGLVYAYRKSETFRDIVDGAMSAVGKIFRSLWNDFVGPVLRFIIDGLAFVMDGIGNMFDALSHVPGFGWAGKLGDSLHQAADQGHALADSIRDIPSSKTVHVNVIVNTSAIAKAQHQLDLLGGATTRGAAGGRGGGLFGLGGNNVGGPGAALITNIVKGIDSGKVRLNTALEKLRGYIQKHQDALTDLLSKRQGIVDAFRGFTSSIFGTDVSTGDDGIPKTIQTLLDAGAQRRANAQTLGTNVQSLLDKGLSRDLLQQMIDAGEAGAQQIALLAGGTQAQIDQANADNDATRAALESAGLAVGDAIYGAGIAQEEANLKLADTIKVGLKELLDEQDKNTVVELHLDGHRILWSLKKIKRANGGHLGLGDTDKD